MKKIIFKKYKSIGLEEVRSAKEVLKSGNLSGFVADNSKDFFGGKYVNKFERNLEKFYRVKHAIVVNSWTSGLICMIGSLDIEPGDEIIVTPWTMAATVASILHWNCIPVFVDINEEDFCIDVNKIKKLPKIVIPVHFAGQPCEMAKIHDISKKYGFKIIEDASLGIGASYDKVKVGSCIHSDITIFSFHPVKIITSAEGGMALTNDNKISAKFLC